MMCRTLYTNRSLHAYSRCLCELAKQMGFTNSARDIFQLEGQIASYMHLVRVESNLEK